MKIFLKTFIATAVMLSMTGYFGRGEATTPLSFAQGEKHLKIIETLNVSTPPAKKSPMYAIKRMLGLSFDPVWYYSQSGSDTFFQQRFHADLAPIETIHLITQIPISLIIKRGEANELVCSCNLRIGFKNPLLASEVLGVNGVYLRILEMEGRQVLQFDVGEIVRHYSEQGKKATLEEITIRLPGQNTEQAIKSSPLEKIVFLEWDKAEKKQWLEARRKERVKLEMERAARIKLEMEQEKTRKEAQTKLEVEREKARKEARLALEMEQEKARKEARLKVEVQDWIKMMRIRNQPWKKAVSNYIELIPLFLAFVAFHWGWRHGLWLFFWRWLRDRSLFNSFSGNTIISSLRLYRSILPLTILIDWSLWAMVFGLGFWTASWVELLPVFVGYLMIGGWRILRWQEVFKNLSIIVVDNLRTRWLGNRHRNLWLTAAAGLFIAGLLMVGDRFKNYYFACGGVAGVLVWHTFIRSNFGVKPPDLAGKSYAGNGLLYIAGFVVAFAVTVFAFAINWGRVSEQFAIFSYYLLVTGIAFQAGVLKRRVLSNG